jgi:hypothetical protein
MYKISMFHADLHGYKACALALKEVNGLRAFQNRVPRRIFGLKRDGIEECCSILHIEDLHNQCSCPDKIRKEVEADESRACSMHWRALVGMPEGNRQVEGRRCR